MDWALIILQHRMLTGYRTQIRPDYLGTQDITWVTHSVLDPGSSWIILGSFWVILRHPGLIQGSSWVILGHTGIISHWVEFGWVLAGGWCNLDYIVGRPFGVGRWALILTIKKEHLPCNTWIYLINKQQRQIFKVKNKNIDNMGISSKWQNE